MHPVQGDLEPVDELTYGDIAGILGYDNLVKTDVSLKLKYNMFNMLYFDNELPRNVLLLWSNRMTSNAGLCRYVRNSKKGEQEIKDVKIVLSTHYHKRYPAELNQTIIHEMIHVKHPFNKHGYKFKAEMYRLNREYNLGIRMHSSGVALVNYYYECVDCGKVYERTKRLDSNKIFKCHVCGGSLEEDYIYDV